MSAAVLARTSSFRDGAGGSRVAASVLLQRRAELDHFPHLLAGERQPGAHVRFEPGLRVEVVGHVQRRRRRGDDDLAGVVYGWPAPPCLPADPFHDALAAQVPAEAHGDLVAPATVVVELMVDPGHRGRGIGRALLSRYVAGHPSAWLCTHPDAPAAALYDSAGWRRRGAFTNPHGDPRVVYTWH